MWVPVCVRVRVHVLMCVRGHGSYGPADASARAERHAGSHAQWSEVRAVLCESLCECACKCACGKVCSLARAEQRRVLIPMVSRDTMRREVVWSSGRGRAEDGMAFAIREDGGDPCSVTGT